MKSFLFLLLLLCFLIACGGDKKHTDRQNSVETNQELVNDQADDDKLVDSLAILVLGNCQDGGSPHAGCEKDCCQDLFDEPDPERMVVSLGIIDPKNEERYLIEASPDISRQMHFLEKSTDFEIDEAPNGIFLTHAHIGHYAGLMQLGREAMNADQVPVYAMPRMKIFLEQNGPWDQLVDLKNIIIQPLENEKEQVLNNQLTLSPFIVPHRDEYSETVGFKILGPNKTAIFIPDIDKWEKWDKDIIEEIKQVDYAFLDATFYDQNELKNRDMSEIPHPFVVESMDKFKNLSVKEKSKIIFIHLNHTNPLLDSSSDAFQHVHDMGFEIAEKGDIYPL